MQIELNNIGKQYNREWIFDSVSHTFTNKEFSAILGTNGSGKSTLLQIIGGFVYQTRGEINYSLPTAVAAENLYKYISIATPYLELPEEYTLRELIDFQRKFKSYINHLSTEEIIEITGLNKSADKPVKQFSSGMKQRVKLALAVLNESPVLLLDEPTSNLDAQGVKWYNMLVQKYAIDKIALICSNHLDTEMGFCTNRLLISK